MQYADGIGNYLYIIFAVIYVIYSIIKAGKKVTRNRPTVTPDPSSQKKDEYKPVQPPTSSPVPDTGDEIKKMLEDLLGGDPEVIIPEKQAPKPKPLSVLPKPAPAKIAPHHPKKEKVTSESAKPLVSKKNITAEPVHFVSHPELTQKVFSETITEEESAPDFDIRQAVIYSEILKRPQY